MEAIGLNPIRLDAIGIDPIRLNAIRLGVPGASSGSVRPYIDPEVLASLVAVCICDGKSNNDPDRAVIKNLVDPDNPFVISNAAYKLNSGFGKYEEDFTNWKSASNINLSSDGTKISTISTNFSCQYNYSSIGRDVPSFKVKISNFTEGTISYYYREEDGNEKHINFGPITVANSNGIVELPKSYNTVENGIGYRGGFIGILNTNIGLTIEQIPSFQGALVTDGVNDMIRSQKTIGEMLEGSTEFTIISMIHLIDINPSIGNGSTNYMREPSTQNFTRVDSKNIDKTGIYGIACSNINTWTTTTRNINNVLGDKNDYGFIVKGTFPSDSRFHVTGYSHNSGIAEITQVAWYWTFISKKSITTDQINQVIAYYNLDKYVKPDIYYDVKRQGLSNNTPDSDWYLKDFSGNGRDMQLYNFAKKLGSGVGKYEEDFISWSSSPKTNITHNKITIQEDFDKGWISYIGANGRNVPAFKVEISGIPDEGVLMYGGDLNVKVLSNGINELPERAESNAFGFKTRNTADWSKLTIEQIPDYEGALVFDAVEDYGQFIGNLGLKDYTVAVDRAYPSFKVNAVPVISDTLSNSGTTPFLFEFQAGDKVVRPFSFGDTTILTTSLELNRKISYQSTYAYNNTVINKGIGTGTGRGLTIGRFGTNIQYANIALWSFLLFPYSLSEFLLERQLKRYKLGTLHPDMVEVRPIINSTGKYFRIEYRNGQGGLIQPGSYLPVGSILRISVVLNNNWDEVSSLRVNGVDIPKSSYSNNNFWIYDATVTKSPQKIDITIDEYIRYEDIVQPYPAIVNLRQNGKNITWGDKLKVGSELAFVNHTNLLPELYTSGGGVFYNGKILYSNTPITAEKSMVFVNPHGYKKDNEPNCIADPQRLRIPNSSYKILGYIPDISGHGNHLKINNSAYAGMSGANGYSEDFTIWLKSSGVKVYNDKIEVNASTEMWLLRQYTTSSSKFKVNIVGIPNNGTLKYGTISEPHQLHNGINELDAFSFDTLTDVGFFKSGAGANDWIGLIIQQIGQYEGSFCLDGVEDFITIPTLASGAKQVLMKVNWNKSGMMYDQRTGLNSSFAIYSLDVANYVAYNRFVRNGNTYIDGVLNQNILCGELKGITHNIICTNGESPSQSPIIGSNFEHKQDFSKMALFTFMSFDDISSEDEIKELNDIVGIEGGYVESPDYYFDAYGKSNNLDEDIDYQGSGTANTKGDIYDKSITGLQVLEDYRNGGSIVPVRNRQLTLNNFAFNEESGYGGWLGIGNLTTALNYGSNTTTNNWKRGGTFLKGLNRNSEIGCGYALATWFDNANHILKFKVKITGLIDADELYICQYNVDDSKIKQQLFNGINEVTLDTSTSSVPGYRYITFRYPPLTNDVDFEFLYEYQNGLVSDGVEDNLKNTNMPVLTDYTWIMKRKRLNDKSSTVMAYKGNSPGTQAFMFELIEGSKSTRSFGGSTVLEGFADLISYQTKTSYNGTTISAGIDADGTNLFIFRSREPYPNYCKGVFYKAMLYSKTIDMLSINMLKNLFERDELIDVNNPIFKKDEL